MSLLPFIISFIISAFLHDIIQKVFMFYKKFDDFNHRSSHNTLATRTGGIGIFITILVISLFYYFNSIEIFDYSLFVPLGIMFIIGVYDDFYKADFKLKFLMQIIVAKILIDQGYLISNYNGLFGLYEIPRLLSQLTTVFVFLIIVNAINFIDGIDGLAITDVVKTILLVELFSDKSSNLSLLGFLIITSLVPLYYFNFKKKRKVFLGDSGSLLLGTVVAIYTFYVLGDNYVFKKGFDINKTFFSILIILYPLIDLLRVFIIRIFNKKSPFHPDKNHIHHIILSKGYSSFKALLIIELSFIFIFLFLFFFAKLI